MRRDAERSKTFAGAAAPESKRFGPDFRVAFSMNADDVPKTESWTTSPSTAYRCTGDSSGLPFLIRLSFIHGHFLLGIVAMLMDEMNLCLNGEFHCGDREQRQLEDRCNGQEGKEAEIFQRCGEESRPSHEEAKSRNAQKWKIRQESQKQKTGDRDWAFGSAKERSQGPEEETIKEIVASVR
jgi:hypothetical protein